MSTYMDSSYGNYLNIYDKPNEKLAKGKIIGIALGVIVFLVGIVMLVLYFTVWKKDSNLGKNKFGEILVRDSTSHVNTEINTGDTLLLTYNPTSIGFGGEASWLYSLDDGSTYHKIVSSVKSNSTKFVVPSTAYTTRALFKVEDTNNTSDYVTTKLITIHPEFELVGGPGVKDSGDIIYVGEPTTSTLLISPTLTPFLKSATDFEIETSPDNKIWTKCIITSFDTAKQSLLWTPKNIENVAFIKISTTSLVAEGKPFEVFVKSRKVTISKPKADCTNTGVIGICDCYMVDSNGKSNNFIPGESVQVRYTYAGTVSSATWEYISEGLTVAFTPVQITPVGSTEVAYTYTLPTSLFSQDFVIKVTSGTTSAVSKSYIVEPSFTWSSPKGGDTYVVFPDKVPSLHIMNTVVTMEGSDITTWIDWEVGVIKKGSTTPTFFNVVISPINTTSISFSWSLSQKDLNITTGNNLSSDLYFKCVRNGQTVIHTSDSPLNFEARSWVPEWGVIKSTINYKGCKNAPVNISTDNSIDYISVDCGVGADEPKWFYSSNKKVCVYNEESKITDWKLTCWTIPYVLFETATGSGAGDQPGFGVDVYSKTIGSVNGKQIKPVGHGCSVSDLSLNTTSLTKFPISALGDCNVNTEVSNSLFSWDIPV